MRWGVIALFVAALFVATAGAAFPFGVVAGFVTSQGKPPPAWLVPGQGIAVLLSATAVFFALGRIQRDQRWKHALAVAAISSALSAGMNLALGLSPAAVAGSVAMTFACMGIGVALAGGLRGQAEPSDRGSE